MDDRRLRAALCRGMRLEFWDPWLATPGLGRPAWMVSAGGAGWHAAASSDLKENIHGWMMAYGLELARAALSSSCAERERDWMIGEMAQNIRSKAPGRPDAERPGTRTQNFGIRARNAGA